MDKQKQILEIAEVIAKYISSRDFEVKFITNPNSKAFPFSHTTGVAEDLYNAGYRKIPENAVVLTMGEYEKLVSLKDDYGKGYEAGVDEGWENSREETAERFAKRMKQAPYKDFTEEWVADEICKEITEVKI